MDTVDRKEFIKKAGCSLLMLAAMGITVSACSSTDVAGEDDTDNGNTGGNESGITITASTIVLDLSKTTPSVLGSPGGFLLIANGGAMAVNVNGTIKAFTNICTHQQCTTSWAFSNSRLVCTCHNSQFNTNGQVVSGPAVTALKEYGVTRNGNIVTINRS
jgi:cytochrome b6-f complex iron-sulfur subunit